MNVPSLLPMVSTISCMAPTWPVEGLSAFGDGMHCEGRSLSFSYGLVPRSG